MTNCTSCVERGWGKRRTWRLCLMGYTGVSAAPSIWWQEGGREQEKQTGPCLRAELEEGSTSHWDGIFGPFCINASLYVTVRCLVYNSVWPYLSDWHSPSVLKVIRWIVTDGLLVCQCFVCLSFFFLFLLSAFPFFSHAGSIALGLAVSICWSAHHFGPIWNISTNVGCFSMTCCTDIHGAKMMTLMIHTSIKHFKEQKVF